MKKIIIAVIAGVCVLVVSVHVLQTILSSTPPVPEKATVTSVEYKTFEYSGEEGKNALEILQSKTTVEQDNSGLVTSINNIKANPSTREYWAFYINGEMAPVGPQDYITKDTDTIEWRLETF